MKIDLDYLESLRKAATPGDWINPEKPTTYVMASDGKIIATCNFIFHDNHCGFRPAEHFFTCPNAKLIAAAVTALPELIRLARIGEAAVKVEKAGGVLVRASWTVGDDAETAYALFRKALGELVNDDHS
jgi:hypothetical protein